LNGNLLHSVLKHGNFLNIDISQGNVASSDIFNVWWDSSWWFCSKFTIESVSERIL